MMEHIFIGFAEPTIQLVPDGTLFIHLFLIALMVGVLSRTLFRPLTKVLEERELTTTGRRREAEEIYKRVQELLSSYEEELRAARTEGYQLLEQQKAKSVKEREAHIASLKTEISEWVEKEKAKLKEESEEARRMLEGETRTLALKIGARVLGRPLREGQGTS